MTPESYKVLVVDDHAIARNGIRLMLGTAGDICVVAEASTAQEALTALETCAVDVAIVDISMRGECGLNLLRTLRRIRPEIAVLMLSTHAEDVYAIRALRSGAAGYLTKDVGIAELVAAVRKAATGGIYISSSLSECLALQLKGDHSGIHGTLSEREFDVMRRLASGETLTSIGQTLFLSPKTISTYRTRVLEKLGVHSNAELTRYALEEGII